MALLYQKEGKVVIITINRPEAYNAVDAETADEFSKACADFRDDPDLWVAIITGAGDKAFCAGADLKKLVYPYLIEKTWKLPPSITRGMDIWKPLIAAINGICLGGGLEIALACDLRVASEKASFGNPEVRWGVIPTWGATQRVPRMIPWAKAAEILLLAQTLDAQEALRYGLINKVVPPQEVMPTAKAWAEAICQLSPLAVRASKEAMYRGVNMSLDDGLRLEMALSELVGNTEDAREGIAAFGERRKPDYKCK